MIKKVIFTDRSDSLLDAYLRDIYKYKILDNSEINSLIEKAQAGDNKARDLVIKSNLRFVVTVAKQFQGRGIPLIDLISSGNEGIAKAVDKFDIKRGTVFLTYAVWWIKQSILSSIYWQGKSIRLPMSQQLLVNAITEATEQLIKQHCRMPSAIEISEITGISEEQIDFLSKFSNKMVSVDDYIGGDEENSQVCEIIPDGEPPLEDAINREYVTAELEDMLDQLTVREHDLICMYFGIGMSSVNPKVIADMYGVGGERIRQMKEAALSKIRRKFGNKLKELL